VRARLKVDRIGGGSVVALGAGVSKRSKDRGTGQLLVSVKMLRSSGSGSSMAAAEGTVEVTVEVTAVLQQELTFY